MRGACVLIAARLYQRKPVWFLFLIILIIFLSAVRISEWTILIRWQTADKSICFHAVVTPINVIRKCSPVEERVEERSLCWITDQSRLGFEQLRTGMLRHLSRVQRHADFLKQCSAVQFVNLFRMEVSYARDVRGDWRGLEVRSWTNNTSIGWNPSDLNVTSSPRQSRGTFASSRSGARFLVAIQL